MNFMLTVFEKYLFDNVAIINKDVELIQSLAVEKKLAKGEFISKEGETAKNIFFVSNGLLRLFSTNANGDECILKFALENSWMNEKESYSSGNPSKFNVQAIENTQLLCWKKDNFDYLLKELPAFKQFMKDLSTKGQVANQNRIISSISTSAEEKYFKFIEKQPEILKRVPLHMIASYLGLRRETLSRIRRQTK